MIDLALREYGATVWVDLPERERELLQRASESWKRSLGLPSAPLRIETNAELTGVTAQGVAGTLRVGDLRVDIAPKFLDPDENDPRDWRQAFWEILIVAQDGRALFGRATGADSKATSIADLLAEVFLRSHAHGTTRGMPMQYTENQELSPAVHGAFDSSQFGRWIVEPWIVPVRESTLTSDTPLARLLGWAAGQLRTLTSSPARARELDAIRHALPGLGSQPPRIEVAERLQVGVQHSALKPALEVALLLLRGHGIRHGSGERDVIGFLWRSEDVYERFVFWLCREAGRSRGLLVRKTSARFGISKTAPPLTTTPDVIFSDSGSNGIAVLDAKYKALNSTPKASDSYQILTSAHHFGCAEVGLVYPSTFSRDTTSWAVASSLGARTATISSLHLDLLDSASSQGRRALVETIGEWLDRFRSTPSLTNLEVAST
jgi:5-methylcytosine-specific restriction endonuclease McrBC regulatory subunit McrC